MAELFDGWLDLSPTDHHHMPQAAPRTEHEIAPNFVTAQLATASMPINNIDGEFVLGLIDEMIRKAADKGLNTVDVRSVIPEWTRFGPKSPSAAHRAVYNMLIAAGFGVEISPGGHGDTGSIYIRWSVSL